MKTVAAISLPFLLILHLSFLTGNSSIDAAATVGQKISTIGVENNGRSVLKDTVKPGITQAGEIVADGAELQLIAKKFAFTEGPAADKTGNVYFTDQPNNKIWKYGINDSLSVFLENAGRANGMYFDRKGNLVACADELDQVWSINSKGAITVLVKDFQGRRLNGPNDLWIHPNGNIYLTDPYYQRSYWTRQAAEIDGEKVYCLPHGKKELKIVEDSLAKPNGIIGTPDGRYLYVADIKANKTYKYVINKDGTLRDKTVFVPKGSDGMTIDNKGNIYITGNGVTVYNNKGEVIEHINVPAKWTANVCFGGKNRNDLFITASKAIYKIRTKVKGVN